ncbi:peptidoglycan DD-metalloendopeptidase family protein [Granulosicoccaceae sp. 1_MG-2023]|nr:peptidoglycan DD-metalloendopeptidase family protein [Granulosicoccaceae sp. 1_MG-2023]
MLLALLAPVPASAADPADYDADIARSREKIRSLDESLRVDKKKRAELLQQLNRYDDQINYLNGKLSALEKRIRINEDSLKSLESELVVKRREAAAEKARLAEQIRAAYRMGHQSGLRLLLSENTPATYSRLSSYADYFSAARQQRISSALDSMQSLAETRLRAAQSRRALESSRDKLRQSRQAQQEAMRSRKRVLAQLESGIVNKSDEMARLEADVARLEALVAELRKRQAAAAKVSKQDRGRLPWPVDGRITANFKQLKPGGKLRWSGLFFSAPVGRDVLAIAAGKAVYADWLTGFGMLVILDHGNGIMSLYGNNRDLLIEPGDQVEKGRVIATVGESGSQNESGLYFEIRENAAPVDPIGWISNRMQFAKTAN